MEYSIHDISETKTDCCIEFENGAMFTANETVEKVKYVKYRFFGKAYSFLWILAMLNWRIVEINNIRIKSAYFWIIGKERP